MLAAYVAVTLAAAIAYAYAAVLNLTHSASIVQMSHSLRVPVSWMTPLGLALCAGSIGLIGGFGVAWLGTAAAIGLIVYFAGAAGAHLRARDTRLLSWVNWTSFFALAVAALTVGVAYHGLT